MKDFNRAKRVAKRVLRGRKAYKEVQRALSVRGELEAGKYRIGVYFADSDVNIYQMRQWYAPLRELNKKFPVLLLSRNALGARALLQEAELPVAYVPKVTSIEKLLPTQPLDLILYVNQNQKNFQMLRYGNRWHVFINHGESDKMYMRTNQHKCYDYVFVAGDAAKQRLADALWNFNVETRTFATGRPQTDHLDGTPPYPNDGKTTVFYAPTWEGDRPAAAYGSILSHGETLVTQLLAAGNYRVIYRPHPRSGVLNSEYAASNERIKAALKAANAADSSAHHIVDESPTLDWQLAAADVAICDISAMIYDRLATGKPLLVTFPVHPEAEVDANGYLSECEWLYERDVMNIADKITALLTDPAITARNAKWAKHYFGDTTKGAPTARFTAAITELIKRADELKARS